jgi:uncharacterized protein
MKRRVLIDTGPLVAFINRREYLHSWVINTLATIEQPLLSCEPVIVETCFLLRNIYGGQEAVMSLLAEEKIIISISLSEEAEVIKQLLRQYQSVPMSLADCHLNHKMAVTARKCFHKRTARKCFHPCKKV